MAGTKTGTFETEVLKAATGQVTTVLTTTPLAGVWVALYTAAPTETTAGTEVTGGSYGRVNSKGKWAAPVTTAGTTTVATNADLVWPTATADWGTVVGFAILDAAAAGNMLYFGTLTANKVVSNGDTFSILTGQLTIQED